MMQRVGTVLFLVVHMWHVPRYVHVQYVVTQVQGLHDVSSPTSQIILVKYISSYYGPAGQAKFLKNMYIHVPTICILLCIFATNKQNKQNTAIMAKGAIAKKKKGL